MIGMTFILFPYAKQILHAADTWPVSRKQLEDNVKMITDDNPSITFDWTYMNEFKNPNCWFIDILTNQKLKKHLYSEISDPNSMPQIYGALKNYFD